MEKGRFALLLIAVAVLIGGLVFLKWSLVGRDLPREQFKDVKLKVLSYSTFTSTSGPAPELVAEFQKLCQCKVEFFTAGDAGLLVERLKLTQDKAHFDVVIGLDQFAVERALRELKWQDGGQAEAFKDQWVDEVKTLKTGPLVPFDLAPMTFIYRKSSVQNPPQSLDDLLSEEWRSSMTLQDPRSSSPGLQFYSWVNRIKKAGTANYLRSLKSSIHSVSPSWALSYGLFKKEQSKFVFSYVTSLAYHLGVEKDDGYGALSFKEGHPVQVEYMGVPEGCRNCEWGQKFVSFLLEPNSQAVIAAKNFMLPAIKGTKLPEIYKQLPELKMLPLESGSPSLEVWDQSLQ